MVDGNVKPRAPEERLKEGRRGGKREPGCGRVRDGGLCWREVVCDGTEPWAGRMLELSSTDSRVGWPQKTPGMQWCPLAWAALPRSVHRPSWPELRVILGGAVQ